MHLIIAIVNFSTSYSQREWVYIQTMCSSCKCIIDPIPPLVPFASDSPEVLVIVLLPTPPASNVPVPVIFSVSLPTVPDETDRSLAAALTVPLYSLVPPTFTGFGSILTVR